MNSNMNVNCLSVASKQELIKVLTCTQCKGIFQTPFTVYGCQHTFCQRCLVNHFLVEKKYTCPLCGIKIGTKNKYEEGIGENYQISSVIKILFPDIEDTIKKATEQIYIFLKHKNMSFPDEDSIINDEKVILELLSLRTPETRSEVLPQIEKKSFKAAKTIPLKSVTNLLSTQLKKDKGFNIDSDDIELYRGGVKFKNYNETLEQIIKNYQSNQSRVLLYYARKKQDD